MKPRQRPTIDRESKPSMSPVSHALERLHRLFISLRLLRKRSFSFMFIPHTDRRVRSIQVNASLVMILGGLVLLLTTSFFVLATCYSGNQQVIVEKSSSLHEARGKLKSMLDQVKDLMTVYQTFQGTMAETLHEMKIDSVEQAVETAAQGDLASIRDTQELPGTEVREVLDIKKLSRALSDAINPLNKISQVWKTQKQLLSDIPNLWPISGGNSAISLEFGPARNPLRGDWYVNKGVNISGQSGVPIVASANGKVTDVRYDAVSGYGAIVEIEHKYGFRTRYTNLGTWIVQPGDEVYQGQRIGTMGRSGIATGNYFHFEIMMGTQVLDPASFLKISTDFGH